MYWIYSELLLEQKNVPHLQIELQMVQKNSPDVTLNNRDKIIIKITIIIEIFLIIYFFFFFLNKKKIFSLVSLLLYK